jgi:uncharacterized membrane protein HdeD (DUF308 family)
MLTTNPFKTNYDLERATRGWSVLLVTGMISMVAGGILLFADWTLNDLATFIGALLVLRGVVSMFSVPVDGSSRGWAIALGLLEFGLGLMVWVWPSPTLLVIAFWIGWYVLFIGTMTIASAIRGRDVLPFWGFMLALGIIEVLTAFWLLGRPDVTLVATVMALGLWTLVYGVTMVVVAFDLKRVRDRSSAPDGGARPLPSSPPQTQPAVH